MPEPDRWTIEPGYNPDDLPPEDHHKDEDPPDIKPRWRRKTKHV